MSKILRNNINLEKSLEFLAGGVLAFSVFSITSHDKSPLKKSLPNKRLKRLHYLPNIKVEITKEKNLHLHHWFIFGFLYIPYFLSGKNRIKRHLVHGFFWGTIIQGLIYKDRLSFVEKSLEADVIIPVE